MPPQVSPKSQAGWIVHKFGGTSLANPERISNAFSLVRTPGSTSQGKTAVVVSAMAGVTDSLLLALDLAKRSDTEYLKVLEQIEKTHSDCIAKLFQSKSPEAFQALKEVFKNDILDLKDLLRAVFLSKGYSELSWDLVAGYGEIWSAQIFKHFAESENIPAKWLNARQVLIIRHGPVGPYVDWEESQKRFDQWLNNISEKIIVITGFVATLPDGTATTLKRNGSDYSASIFSSLLNANELTIWTDVDGVYSADPRRVPDAVVVDELTYNEAMELAYFGAKVIHPHTMSPVIKKRIPVWIRNSLNPKALGTIIHAPEQLKRDPTNFAVTGFSTVESIGLINLEGSGMVGVPGVAQRLFGALRDVGVSVMMISQASSEQSICIAVPEAQGSTAKQAIEEAFQPEIQNGKIQKVEWIPECAILAVVGDNMVQTPGVATRFFGSLSRAGINVRAIAQGSSERNISVIINRKESNRALKAVHSGFYLSDQTLSIGIIGTGTIGSELIQQIKDRSPALKEHYQVDLRVRGIMRSQKMLTVGSTIELSSWQQNFQSNAVTSDLDRFINHVKSDYLPHNVIIDCTASDEIAAQHAHWIARGIHVITPNKKGNSGPQTQYEAIRSAAKKLHVHYLYETTVGAGLPVIRTLQDLIRTGDEIQKIEGIFSGTMSYLFSQMSESQPFSKVVKQAKDLGYTEPDPRDDLSGMDVARKLIILAREMGHKLELKDIRVESLVPGALQSLKTADEFLAALPQYDKEMNERLQKAKFQNQVLRYVGSIDKEGNAAVELKAFSSDSAFSRIQGGDNLIAFTTRYYNRLPLIVQGPGAGPAVTANGIFADLLRLASYLGAQT